MVVLDVHNEACEAVVSAEHASSREERRRTGRYVAAGTAISLSLLGVYQALIQGTPEYAALFAPAVIMFVYVLWILYASKNQNARLLRLAEAAAAAEAAEAAEVAPSIVIESLLPEKVDNEKQLNVFLAVAEEPDPSMEVKEAADKIDIGKQFNRSYSIA